MGIKNTEVDNKYRYLLVPPNDDPLLKNIFNPKEDFKEEVGMYVYDLVLKKYTWNGKDWRSIESQNE